MPTPTRWPHYVREPHDPDAVLDYGIDWSDWLGAGESVASATWTVTGATVAAASRAAGLCVVWLSGASAGTPITAACRITTDNIPARVWRIHSPGSYAFLSQVEGGLTSQRTCVITARVVVLPLTGTLNVPMWRPVPKMTATAFDSQANSSTEQCQGVAREKLREATLAIVSGIVKI
jgi:hypothetical protein